MEASEFFLKGVEGYLWTKLSEIRPNDFIEPSFPVQKNDLVLSHMTFLEKRVYTATVIFSYALSILFDTEADNEAQNEEFYNWLAKTTKQNFLREFKTKKKYQSLMKDDHLESLIKLRRDFLSAYKLLMVLIGQRLDIDCNDCDDCQVNFRQGFSIVIDKPFISSAFFFSGCGKKIEKICN